jgi:lactoylglutathione lyase
MKDISGINHVGIRVTDLAQSRQFYTQLGFGFPGGPMGPEPVAIMEHSCGVNITHSQCRFRRYRQCSDGHSRTASRLHPYGARCNRHRVIESGINELNIPITEGPITLPKGGVMFFIRDPDRNVIEFHQRPAN